MLRAKTGETFDILDVVHVEFTHTEYVSLRLNDDRVVEAKRIEVLAHIPPSSMSNSPWDIGPTIVVARSM